MERVGIVIPAYQVEREIAGVIAGCAAVGGIAGIVVVDDGSTDKTGTVARDAGATLLVHPENRGKGAALLTGFTHASAEDWDAVITIDGDGQNDPAVIPAFIQHFRKHHDDIIIGTRIRGSGMPFPRRISNRISSLMVSRIAGVQVDDSQSGYRLIARKVWENLTFTCTRYDMETEVLIRAGRVGFKIGKVPVATTYADETSHFHPWKDTVRIARLLLRMYLMDY
jgi:glycosyltransferase involved in cell wall biosynthesis